MRRFAPVMTVTLTFTLLSLGGSMAVAQAAVSEAEALTTAIVHAGGVGMKSGGLQISSSGASTRSLVHSVFYLNEGGSVPASGAQTPSFPFVLTSSRAFTPNNPSRPGREPHPAKFFAEVVDANTGYVGEEFFGPYAPPIELLGTVVTLNLTSSEASAASTSCHVTALLVAALARKHLRARHLSAARALSACEARHR
jgi:hypothetical protein